MNNGFNKQSIRRGLPSNSWGVMRLLALKCNFEHINEQAVTYQIGEILQQRLEDVKYLVKNSMEEIIALTTDEPIEDAGHDDITLEE